MSWKDTQYESYFEKIEMEPVRQVGGTLTLNEIKTETYENLIVNNPWRWLKNKWAVAIVGIFVTINVWSNYYFYTQYSTWLNGQPVVDIEQILELSGSSETYFPLSILGFTFSALILAYLFLAMKNLLLFRFFRYLFIVEILSLVGIMSGVFWAALFSWISIGTYMFISFDITWVKPSKEAQLHYSESVKKLQRQEDQK